MKTVGRAVADPPSITQTWEAIDLLPCLQVDWQVFKTRVARFGEDEAVCRCGAHFFSAVLIRDR